VTQFRGVTGIDAGAGSLSGCPAVRVCLRHTDAGRSDGTDRNTERTTSGESRMLRVNNEQLAVALAPGALVGQSR
jgi:hypothetical protein